MLVAFNKVDLPAAAEAWPVFRRKREADGLAVVAISAATGEGVDAFRARLADLLPDSSDMSEPPEPAGIVVHRIEAMGDGFTIEPEEDGVFRVRGMRIERIAAQTNFDVEESAERFQRDLAQLGIDAGLRRAGIVPGDLVRIGADRARMGAGTVGRAVTAARSRRLVGVFGGTFDPIHLAHLAVAEEARDSLGLERVLFVPAGVPPHKPGQPISPAADRLAMVEAGDRGQPGFGVSRIELDRPGPSYTVDTLEALRGVATRTSC